MSAEDHVTARVRHRAVEQRTDGDTNEAEVPLFRFALISDTTLLFTHYFLMHSF